MRPNKIKYDDNDAYRSVACVDQRRRQHQQQLMRSSQTRQQNDDVIPSPRCCPAHIGSLPPTSSATQHTHKAVTDRRLRPRCCHQGSYLEHPKNSSAHFTAKPKAACALRFSWAATQLGGDVEQPWLMSKYDVIHKSGST